MTTLREKAQLWAIEAGKLLMEQYGNEQAPQIVSDPSVKNFSTLVDIEIQRTIRHHILEEFPDHAFIGEEEGLQESVKADGYTWVVDPLDGTLNYYFGVPLFVVAIGILKDRIPAVGVVYDPVHRELYTAERGQGKAVIINTDTGVEKPLAPANTTQLSKAIIMTHLTTHDAFRERFLQSGSLASLASNSRQIRMLGTGHLALAYVARGRFHGFISNHTNLWDVVAGRTLVELAGGVVTDFAGQPWTPEAQGIIAACNEPVHTALVNLLQNSYYTHSYHS